MARRNKRCYLHIDLVPTFGAHWCCTPGQERKMLSLKNQASHDRSSLQQHTTCIRGERRLSSNRGTRKASPRWADAAPACGSVRARSGRGCWRKEAVKCGSSTYQYSFPKCKDRFYSRLFYNGAYIWDHNGTGQGMRLRKERV